MDNSNKITLESYQNNFQNYVEGTAQKTEDNQFQGQWIISVLDRLGKNAHILEIGSAFGRDARFIYEKGYHNLELTDAFDAAVNYLNQSGLPARKLNILQDKLEGNYDAIFASAVFLHFTREELRTILDKLIINLSPSGYLAFSVKQGSGDEWSDHKIGSPRYFCYWQNDELISLLSNSGYKIVDIRNTDDQKWIHVIAQPS